MMVSTMIAACIVAACSSVSSTKSADQRGSAPSNEEVGSGSPSVEAGEARPDAAATRHDAGAGAGEDAGPTTGCRAKRASNADLCAEDCDARLLLPAGGYYCSRQCEDSAECAPLDSAPASTLVCPNTIGACVPRCTSDATCKSAGFLRCDLSTGGCDTIDE